MASKRPSADLIPNPLIKRRNLNWTLDPPDSKSPPKTRDNDIKSGPDDYPPQQKQQRDQSTSSVVESGQVPTANHLPHFTNLLTTKDLDSPLQPLLPVASYVSLYQSHVGSTRGSHFVIHQHDHPIAGTHYDLRLQINPTSSVSWAIMYGPPGDPNSSRPNRNATETRIHSLWNHLVETASPHTGSLLIWDTGTYTVLPRRSKHDPLVDPASQESTSSSSSSSRGHECQQALLARAFSNRKIRLRLHGSKLPHNYVLNLRLTKTDDQYGRAKNANNPPRKKRRRRRRDQERAIKDDHSDRDDDDDGGGGGGEKDLPPAERNDSWGISSSTERELQELEDAEVVRTNAYPGATNSIGSIHQRKWYLSLDREASGFVARRAKNGKIVWESAAAGDADAGTEADKAGIHREGNRQRLQRLSFPFYVRGPACERSVVTGRRADDVLRDEGVEKFIPRKGWKPVLN
ncbi:hypothetical protein E4U21_006371 [Claviceps maximensis]|nr:hypothetical protein E4U21_006371 [Claviceps maximensis]